MLVAALVISVQAATYDVTVEEKADYFGWGKAYMVKNDLVTLAIVPDLGGRVMQYDLGTHPSIYIHESSKGDLPTSGNTMIGGFRQLPSPQSDFGWPSPPAVDFGKYTPTVVKQSADSVIILLESPVENSTDDKYKTHKGLQFKRTITLYRSSTRVKVVMTMLNKGTAAMTHGIWDITQSDCSNGGEPDTSNFWVYFKKGTIGGSQGYVQYMDQGSADTEWKPDAVGGGIMSTNYQQQTGKIGADCRAGWIAFADQLDGYAYIKTFTYENGKTYPDSGASVQVYTYTSPAMLEVEVLGPKVTLQAGDSTTLTENWFASRTSGAIIDVNAAGLTVKKLSATRAGDTVTTNGTFGVFYPGTLKWQLFGSDGNVIATADSNAVVPTDSFVATKKFAVTAGAAWIGLQLCDSKGTVIGLLDSTNVPPASAIAVSSSASMQNTQQGSKINVLPGRLSVTPAAGHGPAVVSLFTLNGALLQRYSVEAPSVIDIKVFENRTLLCRIEQAGQTCSRMIATR